MVEIPPYRMVDVVLVAVMVVGFASVLLTQYVLYKKLSRK